MAGPGQPGPRAGAAHAPTGHGRRWSGRHGRRLAAAGAGLAVVLAGLLPAPVSPATASAAPAGVTVTYLANEGFLLESGETSVLVDALFGEGIPGYPAVPPAIRADLEAGRGRFAGVDLILASHHHRDHFDAAAVARHLRANPGAVFLSTRQAVAALRQTLGADAGSYELIASYPEEGRTEQLERPGLVLTVLNLHHGRGRRPPVENLGLILELGGVELLHVGDTEAEAEVFRVYRLQPRDIDVALVPGWFLAEPRWLGVTRGEIGARRLVAMHLAEPDAPASWFGSAGSLGGRVARIRAAFPDAWVPQEPLASRHYPAPDNPAGGGRVQEPLP